MLLLLFVIASSSAEWVSELNLVNRSMTLSDFVRVNHYLPFLRTGLLCVEHGCANLTDSILVSNATELGSIIETLNYSRTIDSLAVIFKENTTFDWEILYPRHRRDREVPVFAVFYMEETQWEVLYSTSVSWSDPITAEINYYYDCISYSDHCESRWLLTSLFTCFTVLWSCFLGYWVYTVFWSPQRGHSQLFHKFATTLLVFKVLNTLSTFLLVNNCPPTPAAYQFSLLLMQQSRSLYETSFFLQLLILSKGWIIARENITAKEFKYFVVYTILLYIMDSSVNIARTTVFSIVSYIMYLSLLINCCYFCVRTIQGVYIQIQVSSQIRLPEMSRAFQDKKRMFFTFIALLMSYFVCEAFSHFVLIPIVASINQPGAIQFGIFEFFHEAFELVIIVSLYFLYRPRCLGRYFSLNLYDFESTSQPVIAPFYDTQAPFEGTPPLVFLKTPSAHFLIGEVVCRPPASAQAIEFARI